MPNANSPYRVTSNASRITKKSPKFLVREWVPGKVSTWEPQCFAWVLLTPSFSEIVRYLPYAEVGVVQVHEIAIAETPLTHEDVESAKHRCGRISMSPQPVLIKQ